MDLNFEYNFVHKKSKNMNCLGTRRSQTLAARSRLARVRARGSPSLRVQFFSFENGKLIQHFVIGLCSKFKFRFKMFYF